VNSTGSGALHGHNVEAMSGLMAPERERAGHVGLVYTTVQVRDDTVVAFVEAGLRLGEHVVVAIGIQGGESAVAQNPVDTDDPQGAVP
jgi:hypothetical protein